MPQREKKNQGVPEAGESAGVTRREMFGMAGMALAASALPGRFALGVPRAVRSDGAASAVPGVSPVMLKLSEYMSAAGGRALPENVAETTKQHILDTMAAMISGSKLDAGKDAIRFITAYGGKPVSTVVATNLQVGPIEAALTNAMMAHGDETDDSASAPKSHPGCGVVPAALSMGEHMGTSGTRLIRAVALGYDIGNRVTLTLGGRSFEAASHWSTHTICPLFGASAACGSIAGFDPHQMRIMLGYTGQQSSGLGAWDRDTQHVQKAFVFGGIGARGGVLSAMVVQNGWTGVEDIFSGADNFFDAYKPGADPAGLIDQLGEVYQVMLTDIKKWCVGTPIQAVLDALVLIQKKRPYTADQVRHVTVQLPKQLAVIVNNRKMPDINVQQMTAVMMMDHNLTFKTANDMARMTDPATVKQRAKVQLVPSEALNKLLPVRAAIVEMTFNDGTSVTQEVKYVRGSFKNPMTTEEVASKARDLIEPIMGTSKTNALIDKVTHLEAVKDVRELRPLLQTS